MTFYQQQLKMINHHIYPKAYITERITKVKKFIHEFYFTNITLDDMAAVSHISKYHFLRLFKQYFGCTPNNYLNQIRIDQAKLLLKKGMKVVDACYAVGFESSTAFAILFKKKTGISPQHYKKSKKK